MAIDRIGKFTILETLGQGAHSRVLRIRREEDGKDYVLKLITIETPEDRKYLEQARHEYRVAQTWCRYTPWRSTRGGSAARNGHGF